MEKSKKILKIYTLCFILLAVACIVLRAFSLAFFYDADVGYYKTEAVLPAVFHIFCIAAFAAAAVLIFLLPKNAPFGELVPGKPTRFASSFQAVVTLAMAVYLVYLYARKEVPVPAVALLCVAGAFFAVIYFVLVASGKAVCGKDGAVLCGYGVIFYVIMLLASSYFDFHTTMNSPNKMLLQIAMMSVMAAFLLELRALLCIARPGVYAAFTLFAAFASGVSSVPGIIFFIKGTLTKPIYFACDFVLLGFCFYFISRYFGWLKSFFSAKK